MRFIPLHCRILSGEAPNDLTSVSNVAILTIVQRVQCVLTIEPVTVKGSSVQEVSCFCLSIQQGVTHRQSNPNP